MNAWTWIHGEVVVASAIFHLLLPVMRRRCRTSGAFLLNEGASCLPLPPTEQSRAGVAAVCEEKFSLKDLPMLIRSVWSIMLHFSVASYASSCMQPQ